TVYRHILLTFPVHDTPTAPISPLSLHDALPISSSASARRAAASVSILAASCRYPSTRVTRSARMRRYGRQSSRQRTSASRRKMRSEEHTSELQSRSDLVCRLLLEKKKTT